MTTAPKPFVFVLMPFAEEFNDLYYFGIRQACEEAGAYCQRVSEQIYEGKVIDRIYNQISTADFIVAVMSGKNPNVFYEVGYAHALNKRVILATNNVKDIPFDLAAYPHIEYSNITELKEEVSKRLNTLIAQPETESTFFNFPLKFLCHGKPLDTISEVPLTSMIPYQPQSICASRHEFTLPIDIVNSVEKSILPFDFRVGFVCKSEISGFRVYQDSAKNGPYGVSFSKQEDGQVFCLINSTFSLLPGDFTKLVVYLDKGWIYTDDFCKEEHICLTIRILTAAGPFNQDFNFTLKQVGARPRGRDNPD